MKNFNIKSYAVLVILLVISQFSSAQHYERKVKNGELSIAYFASGCFWCVEAIYESVKGVEEVVSGYSGGHTNNPTYKLIGTGKTGHAETVAVYYNPTLVSYQSLVEVYFGSQDPTTFGQKPDFGSPYRSLIFYQNNKEKEIADRIFSILNKEIYSNKMVTEIKIFEKFYQAEEYHQNFEKLHPDNAYVKNISIPRLNRFKNDFPELLK